MDCGDKFDDVNYEKFGTPTAKRLWCNQCVEKRWTEREKK